MKNQTAFIGDVHGHPAALEGALEFAVQQGVAQVVLLGDYVNKGPDSRGVIDVLCSLADARFEAEVHPLLGNHESVFLETINSGDVRPLLRLSGAPTIRSYVGGKVGADVFSDFRRAIPREHINFLESLTTEYSEHGVVASHKPGTADGAFTVSAHTYAGHLPKITSDSAQIETGCGNGGRLTTLLWPSLGYAQFAESGAFLLMRAGSGTQ